MHSENKLVMNEQEMREAWNELSQRVSRLESLLSSTLTNNLERALSPRAQTALDSLAKKYLRFAIVGAVMVICSIPYSQLDVIRADVRLPLCIGMMIYFGLCSVMDLGLYHKVKEIDISRMSVVEVSDRALKCRRRHLQSMAVLIPIAAVLVCGIIYALGADKYAVYGAIGGAAIGLAFGYTIFRRMMSDYKVLKNS